MLWFVMVRDDAQAASDWFGPHSDPFNLMAGEVSLMFFGSVIYSQETISRSYVGGYSGLSIRVAHGLYYHFGGFEGERRDSTALQEIDYGGMLLTTQNIYFGGSHTRFRVPY